jgi:hypothetical protein
LLFDLVYAPFERGHPSDAVVASAQPGVGGKEEGICRIAPGLLVAADEVIE